ncbi:Uma2 family endonuclease [Enterovirga aerilata]|uniref:Uma2 family endonuclease n=1 Tax=Enterovirga aerilata TaxID=2730920 RepID=A0A849I6D8_9HYPH|nr:Uma2 family endonuclease [Enterovirga sp. DB1703]NNM72948.1 Uma2 family endonuclease [Enterovirga sp. DB1703]
MISSAPATRDAPSLAEGLRRRRFPVADVVRMVELGLIQEDERLEVLDGEIVEMSPKGYRHEGLKGAINRLWGRHCPDGFDYMQETGLYLSEWTYLEPDFVVFPASVALRELKGPDVLLAIEVADSSLDYDLGRKPGIYASFGVQELWVIDVPRRLTHVHRDPGEHGYSRIERVPASSRLEPLHAPAALGFALDDLGRS